MTTPTPVLCPCGATHYAAFCHICKTPSPLYLYLTQRRQSCKNSPA